MPGVPSLIREQLRELRDQRVRHLWRRSPPGQVQQGVARRPRVFQVVLFVAVVIGLAAFAAQLAGH